MTVDREPTVLPGRGPGAPYLEPHPPRLRPSKLRAKLVWWGWPLVVVSYHSTVPTNTLSAYMNRRRAITPEHMDRLVTTLDCEPEDIWEPAMDPLEWEDLNDA